MVIVIGNGHSDLCSNPGRGGLHFHIVLIPLGKVCIPTILPQTMDKKKGILGSLTFVRQPV